MIKPSKTDAERRARSVEHEVLHVVSELQHWLTIHKVSKEIGLHAMALILGKYLARQQSAELRTKVIDNFLRTYRDQRRRIRK